MSDVRPATKLPITIALSIIGLTVLGAVFAIAFDLHSAFVIGEARAGDLGPEVIWQGSAISAPLPPIIGLVVGAVLAGRRGAARTIGLLLLTLAGLIMVVGVVGEFTGGAQFDGLRQLLFWVFSVAYAVLATALATSSMRALFRRAGPI